MSHRRYALVGAGHRAQMYVDAITGRYADEAVLVAICEPNPVRARYYVDRVVAAGLPAPAVYGPDDLEAMIRDLQVDRVVICARDDLHAPLIVRSLDAGADVVVEKPLTIDGPSAAAIEDAIDLAVHWVLGRPGVFRLHPSARQADLAGMVAQMRGTLGQDDAGPIRSVDQPEQHGGRASLARSTVVTFVAEQPALAVDIAAGPVQPGAQRLAIPDPCGVDWHVVHDQPSTVPSGKKRPLLQTPTSSTPSGAGCASSTK